MALLHKSPKLHFLTLSRRVPPAATLITNTRNLYLAPASKYAGSTLSECGSSKTGSGFTTTRWTYREPGGFVFSDGTWEEGDCFWRTKFSVTRCWDLVCVSRLVPGGPHLPLGWSSTTCARVRQRWRPAYRTWESGQRLVTNPSSHRPFGLGEQWGSHMIHPGALPRRQRATLLHHRKKMLPCVGAEWDIHHWDHFPFPVRLRSSKCAAPKSFLLTFTVFSETIPRVRRRRLMDVPPVWG